MEIKLDRIYVSFDEMQTAFIEVRQELQDLDLLFAGSRLDKVECYYERFSLNAIYGMITSAMGFYDFGDQNIHIPALFPTGLLERYEKRVVLDVIRHEFGHALADKYRKYFRGGIFKEAFGASYGTKKVCDGGGWTDEYVTEYAATCTREDFAETFMLYLKHKGMLPVRYLGCSVIVKKWKTVAQIIKDISALGK